ncbi:hypothetical protein JOE27_003531 [Pseudomonas sp. M5]|nr:hypothetical protein [Pseudomonas sp. M5]
MVRLSRPESAACAVRSGIPAVPARINCAVVALAAIIDALRFWTTPRSAVSLPFLYSCPSNSLRTRLFPVYPLCSCVGVFALATHSIQNQCADHITS